MKTLPTEFGILVGVDGSEASDAAVRWAAEEAVLRHERLTLLHVVAPLVLSWPVIPVAREMTGWQLSNAEVVTASAEKIARGTAGVERLPDVTTAIRHAGVAGMLVDWSRNASATVVGCRRLGALRSVLEGSVSGHVMRHARGAVVVTHSDEARAFDPTSPVVLGIDGTPASEDATAWAFAEASRRGVELVAVHAWSDTPLHTLFGIDWEQCEAEGREVLSERLAGWREHYPDVTVRHRIVVDHPADRLIDASQQAQLVVVGSHGRSGFAGTALGSVAAKVAAGAAAPTIVVHAR